MDHRIKRLRVSAKGCIVIPADTVKGNIDLGRGQTMPESAQGGRKQGAIGIYADRKPHVCQTFVNFGKVLTQAWLAAGEKKKSHPGFLCFLSKAQPLMGAELRPNGRHLRGCQTDIAHFALKIAAGSQFENSTDRNPKIGAFSGEKSPDIRACFFHNVWFPLSKQCIIGNLNSSLVRTAIQTVYRNLTE